VGLMRLVHITSGLAIGTVDGYWMTSKIGWNRLGCRAIRPHPRLSTTANFELTIKLAHAHCWLQALILNSPNVIPEESWP
jgi:hypothetical protein